MPLEQQNSDHSTVEAALASLVPADWKFDRDRLLYSAGAQAAYAKWKNSRRLLFAAAAGSTLASAVLAGVLLSGPQIERADHAVMPATKADIEDEATAEKPEFAHGFSPILDVEHWNVDRLRKAGITIQQWSHKLQTQDPPREWVQVAFDCSKLTKKQDVLMTARFVPPGQSQAIATRSVRDAAHPDTVSILCSAPDDTAANSHVDIFIWRPVAGGGSEAHGYRLSLKRIVELAREQAANKPAVE